MDTMYLLALDWTFVLEKIILIISIVSISLVVAMYETYAERKVAAIIQDRRGPNRAGPFEFIPEMPDRCCNGPCGGISERANCIAFNASLYIP